MKKIIGTLIAIAALSVLVGSAFTAAFSDQESSQQNELKAGILNLQLGNSDTYILKFNNEDPLAPGSEGAIKTSIGNDGDVEGNFYVSVSLTNDIEGENPPPEKGTNTDPADGGELDNCVDVRATVSNATETASAVLFDWIRADQLHGEGQTWDEDPGTAVDDLINDGDAVLTVQWEVNQECGNEMMGDIFDLNFEFHLDQY